MTKRKKLSMDASESLYFTDEDFTKLKALHYYDSDGKVLALLHRLECAEKVCSKFNYFLQHGIIDPEYNSEEYEVWLQASGETGSNKEDNNE